MPHVPYHHHFKTFADSVRAIRRLGNRLSVLQADVMAIKRLPVDDNGDADAIVSVGKSVLLHTGLRLRPAVMLGAKEKEICRTTEALRSEFSEILVHAEKLVDRCDPPSAARRFTPHLAVALKRMEREIEEMIARSGRARARLPNVTEPLVPPLRPRIATPGPSRIS